MQGSGGRALCLVSGSNTQSPIFFFIFQVGYNRAKANIHNAGRFSS